LPKNRQSIMYSATLPAPVLTFAKTLLKKDNVVVDSVGDVVDQTHEHVPQSLVISSHRNIIGNLESVIADHLNTHPKAKILTFFPTAREASFMAKLFKSYEPLEMHSRLTQNARDRTAKVFKEGDKHQIMFSSDVSARGMDYPDITMIIQVGIVDKTQYIQRLGRTARAGKSGEGVLLVSDFEAKAVAKNLNGINLDVKSFESVVKSEVMVKLSKVERDPELKLAAERSYRAWIGYYKTYVKTLGIDLEELVALGNKYSSYIGLQDIPSFEPSTAGKMGIRNVKGVKIERREDSGMSQQGGRGGRGGRW
jgi:ATP-dependent RNA helicase MSS116